MTPSTTKPGLSHEDEVRSLQTEKYKGRTCVQMAEGKRTPRRGSQTLIQGENLTQTKQFCLWGSMNTPRPRMARKALLLSQFPSTRDLFQRNPKTPYNCHLAGVPRRPVCICVSLASWWLFSTPMSLNAIWLHSCCAQVKPYSPLCEKLSSSYRFKLNIRNICSGLQWLLSQSGSVLYKVTISLLRFPFQEEEKSHVVI